MFPETVIFGGHNGIYKIGANTIQWNCFLATQNQYAVMGGGINFSGWGFDNSAEWFGYLRQVLECEKE